MTDFNKDDWTAALRQSAVESEDREGLTCAELAKQLNKTPKAMRAELRVLVKEGRCRKWGGHRILTSGRRQAMPLYQLVTVVSNKEKGIALETEFVQAARAAGLSAEQAEHSDGRSKGWERDVDCLIGGKFVQCKQRRAIPSYLQIPKSCDAVGMCQDGGPRLILIREELFLKLLAHGPEMDRRPV